MTNTANQMFSFSNFHFILFFYLLGHFEDSQQPQGSETRKTEGTGPLLKVDPKDFKNGSSDDGKVKAVEGGGEVNKDS